MKIQLYNRLIKFGIHIPIELMFIKEVRTIYKFYYTGKNNKWIHFSMVSKRTQQLIVRKLSYM